MKTLKFKGETLIIEKSRYDNGRIAIRITDDEGFPYMMATVNVPRVDLPKNHTFIKNYSENSGILAALEKQGFVKATGKVIRLNFVVVHEVEVLF